MGESGARLVSLFGDLSEKELVDLTLAIVAINGWNRLAISFRTVPGTYIPAQRRVGEGVTDAQASRKEAGQETHA